MIKLNNRKQKTALISWAAVFLWMLLIFNLSSQVAEHSNQLSKGVTKIVIETVERVVPQADFDISRLNHIIRKNAHFFAYLLLGVLVISSIRRSGMLGYKVIAISLLICVFYAVSDEVHQLFVPGRGAQVTDVLIDSVGASVGIGTYWVLSILSRGKPR